MAKLTDEQREANGRILLFGIALGMALAAAVCIVVGLFEDIGSMRSGNRPAQWTTVFYVGGLLQIPAFLFMLWGPKKETAQCEN